MNFLSINKLLNKCNISPSYLINNDNFFYNKMTYVLKNININQIGGDCKINLGDDDYITLDKYIEGDQIFFAFKGKTSKLEDNINGTPCILLLKEEDRMHISQFNVFGNYCLTFKNRELSGTDILFTIIKFIESKKLKYGIKSITLVDTSEKFCENLNIPLSDFKILISGDSWYGSYGFEPAIYKNGTYQISNNEKEKYENNKKIIMKLTVSDSNIEDIIKGHIILINSGQFIGLTDYKKIGTKHYKKIIRSLDNLLLNVLKNKNDKLSTFLQNYFNKDNFKERCLGLSVIIEKLFSKNNLVSFMNKIFIKLI